MYFFKDLLSFFPLFMVWHLVPHLHDGHCLLSSLESGRLKGNKDVWEFIIVCLFIYLASSAHHHFHPERQSIIRLANWDLLVVIIEGKPLCFVEF